jgi:hypothetical protein
MITYYKPFCIADQNSERPWLREHIPRVSGKTKGNSVCRGNCHTKHGWQIQEIPVNMFNVVIMCVPRESRHRVQVPKKPTTPPRGMNCHDAKADKQTEQGDRAPETQRHQRYKGFPR